MQQAVPLEKHDLEEAFRSLAEVSHQLDASYRDLESRVARLNEELAASRSARLDELAEKERLLERLASLMAMLPGGVLLIDERQQVRDANPEAVALFGEPLLGEDWPAVQARIREHAPERHLSLHSRHLAQQGETLVLVTDTTELHDLQAQVGREQRLSALGEMAARLAHQIRTPLSSTTLYLAQLRRPDLAVAQRERICDRLSERLVHMEGLIESMLGFVRGAPPRTERVCLQDVLGDFQAHVLARLEAAGATLSVTPVDRTLALQGDRDALAGALANLVVNAIEAGGEGVHVDVWAGALNRERMLLRVRDNGPGVAPELRERIFDPFFTTRSAGTGLGLAVVARTVSELGGEIRLGDSPEGGAEFVLELPIAEGAC